jgi:RNA polymerase sigma factor (sigma-70 family)
VSDYWAEEGAIDSWLVEQAINGSAAERAEARRGLYQRHAAVVLSTCLRFGLDPQDAEETANDTFDVLYTTLARLRRTQSVRAYLRRIARNKAIDRLRAVRRNLPLDHLSQQAFSDPSHEDAIVGRQEVKWFVRTLIGGVKCHHPDLMRLIFLDERDGAELAQHLGITAAAAHRLKYKALRSLKAAAPALALAVGAAEDWNAGRMVCPGLNEILERAGWYDRRADFTPGLREVIDRHRTNCEDCEDCTARRSELYRRAILAPLLLLLDKRARHWFTELTADSTALATTPAPNATDSHIGRQRPGARPSRRPLLTASAAAALLLLVTGGLVAQYAYPATSPGPSHLRPPAQALARATTPALATTAALTPVPTTPPHPPAPGPSPAVPTTHSRAPGPSPAVTPSPRTATLAFSTQFPAPGDTYTITATGFGPGEVIRFSGDPSPQVTTATTDSAGTVTATLTVDAAAASGTYAITATGRTTATTASGTITVTSQPGPPTLTVSATPLSTGQAVTATGTGFPANTPVTVEVVTTGYIYPDSATTDSSGTFTLTTTDDEGPGRYTIRATAAGVIAEAEMTVPVTQPACSPSVSAYQDANLMSFTVYASGFLPNDTVELSFFDPGGTSDSTGPAATATADDSGSASFNSLAPATGLLGITVISAACGQATTTVQITTPPRASVPGDTLSP